MATNQARMSENQPYNSSSAASSFALGAYLDQLIEELRTLLPRAVKHGEPEAIHESRVATRRLKAAMDLFRPVLAQRHAKRFRRTLRLLRRSLGPLRDADVMLSHLQKLSGRRGNANTAAAVAWLSQQITRERDKARSVARSEIAPSRALAKLGAWWGICEELDDLREATDSLLAESVHAQLQHFRAQADRLSQAGDAQAE